jgi:hypothetical protein
VIRTVDLSLRHIGEERAVSAWQSAQPDPGRDKRISSVRPEARDAGRLQFTRTLFIDDTRAFQRTSKAGHCSRSIQLAR